MTSKYTPQNKSPPSLPAPRLPPSCLEAQSDSLMTSKVDRPQAGVARFKLDRSSNKDGFALWEAVPAARSATPCYNARPMPWRGGPSRERPNTSLGLASPTCTPRFAPAPGWSDPREGLGVRPSSAGMSSRIALKHVSRSRGTQDALPPGWWHKQRTFHTELHAAIMGTNVKTIEAVLAKAEVLHITNSPEVVRARQRLATLRDMDRRLVAAAAGCSIEDCIDAIESAKAIGADESWPSFVDATERESVLKDVRKELYEAMHSDDLIHLSRAVARASALGSTETIEYRDAELRLEVMMEFKTAKMGNKISHIMRMRGVYDTGTLSTQLSPVKSQGLYTKTELQGLSTQPK